MRLNSVKGQTNTQTKFRTIKIPRIARPINLPRLINNRPSIVNLELTISSPRNRLTAESARLESLSQRARCVPRKVKCHQEICHGLGPNGHCPRNALLEINQARLVNYGKLDHTDVEQCPRCRSDPSYNCLMHIANSLSDTVRCGTVNVLTDASLPQIHHVKSIV